MSSLVFPLAALGAYIQRRSPYDSTLIDEAAAGNELRSSWYAQQRTKYVIAFDVVRSDTRRDYQTLVSFFKRHRGQLDSFLLQDPEDNVVAGHGFGIGDGSTTQFQLQRRDLGSTYDALGGPWGESSIPRTNVIINSQDLTAPLQTGITATANFTLAPDGTKTATKLAYSGAGASNGLRFFRDSGFTTTSDTWVTSIWLRSDTPVTLVLSSSAADASQTVTLGTSWTRYVLVGTAAGGVAADISINQVGNAAMLFYGWGLQSEIAPQSSTVLPSRYIATAGSAVTVSPVFWPGFTDGFAPVTDLNGPTSILDNGALKTLGTDYTLPGSGAITFGSAPTAGHLLSWSSSYFIRCRFADPQLDLDRIVAGMWSSATVNLVSA